MRALSLKFADMYVYFSYLIFCYVHLKSGNRDGAIAEKRSAARKEGTALDINIDSLILHCCNLQNSTNLLLFNEIIMQFILYSHDILRFLFSDCSVLGNSVTGYNPTVLIVAHLLGQKQTF